VSGAWRLLRRDHDAIVRNDPTARGAQPFLYPCLHAIALHRLLSHPLHRAGFQFLARLVNQIARFLTGLDIHPGARIGGGFFVDHAMGVVIGETAEVGVNCVLFHNVTLGGTGHHQGKRHPTIGDNVFIGTAATLLGPITVGSNVRVGAGTVIIMHDVPDNVTVVGAPARIVKLDGRRVDIPLKPTATPVEPGGGLRAGSPRPNQDGFTLLEVMAAVVILSIALVSLLQANNQSILLKGRAQNVTTATLLAREKLSEIRADPEGLEETQSGDFGDRFPFWRWEATAEEEDIPYDFGGHSSDRAGSAAGGAGGAKGAQPGAAPKDEPGTRKITLSIFWPEGTKEASFTLTEYLARLVAATPGAGGGSPTGAGSLSSPATSEKKPGTSPAPKGAAP
jgi:serine O-acetyltransferase